MKTRSRNARHIQGQRLSNPPTMNGAFENSAQLALMERQDHDDEMGFLDRQEADGPFSAEVNALLTECFGDISGLDASWSNEVERVGANATTECKRMVFGSAVREDVSDSFSMEVIAHEVAHALAGGGSGETDLDEVGDPGEAIAYEAGERFAAFTAGSASAPQLGPARGGRARIHRHNSLEHRDAVDGAAGRLPSTPGMEDARAKLSETVRLDNGVALTPGQVSMLMGDYFGVMRTEPDRERELDPMASWQQLSSSDPGQLHKLLAEIDKEATGEARALRLNSLTDGRYKSLALVNDCHFSKELAIGTDNNVGTYEAFHALALQVAQEDPNLALGLEASAMHFLVDRHAPGHLMEKRGVQDAAGSHMTGAAGANMHVKHVHDHFNTEGKIVQNAEGREWKAYGDGMWASEENTDSRRAVADSVLTSYRELAEVMSDETNVWTALMDGADATRTLPVFDPDHQDACEIESDELPCSQAKLEMLEYLVK